MADAVVAAPVATPNGPNVFARLLGVVFSPRATYAAIVARPRVLGAFVITICITAVTEGLFFATPVMQEVLLDQHLFQTHTPLSAELLRTEQLLRS